MSVWALKPLDSLRSDCYSSIFFHSQNFKTIPSNIRLGLSALHCTERWSSLFSGRLCLSLSLTFSEIGVKIASLLFNLVGWKFYSIELFNSFALRALKKKRERRAKKRRWHWIFNDSFGITQTTSIRRSYQIEHAASLKMHHKHFKR